MPGSKRNQPQFDAPEASVSERDAYAWLEELEGEKALDWVRAQNAQTLATLEADPRFSELHAAALSILTSKARIPAVSLLPGRVRNFWQDERHVRGLWREASLAGFLSGAPDWRTILDIDALGVAEGENWVFAGVTGLAPEHDRAILSLSRGGSDAAVRREFSVSERSFVAGGFSFSEAKGAVAWRDADSVLAALASSPDEATLSGYPIAVRLVRRGEALDDAAVLFRGEKADIGVWPSTIYADGARLHIITRARTFFESEHYILGESGAIEKLPLPLKAEIEGALGGRIIASLQEDWKAGRRRFQAGDLIALDWKSGACERVFRPNDRQAVNAIAVTGEAVLAQILDNVVGRVFHIERRASGWRASEITAPAQGVAALAAANPYGRDAFLEFESPVSPPALHYVGNNGAPREVMKGPAFFNAKGLKVIQQFAISKDGEKIPYFVVGAADVLRKGGAPTIQYGYGGFEVAVTPEYSGLIGKLWLERGGVHVIANIRGGGEFGPRWHQAALKHQRQRAFDDFFAVSQALIKSGVTAPARLGAAGGSNGGLLMGVALTQRPDLYAALSISVPLLDMIRYTALLAGASWVGEYGDPAILQDRDLLLSYSPYHNLRKSGAYPAPIFFTSTKDDRVHPAHARKMAAKMADLGHKFFYYENIEGGHGAAANQQQAAYRAALQYVYFSRQLMDA